MSGDNEGIVPLRRPKEILDLSYYNTTEEKVKHAHDNWSATYEQDMLDVCKYQVPDLIVPVFQKGVKEEFSLVKGNALSVLDVGAGTGILGERLSAAEFTNLQAIDLSPKMLAIAEKKRIYKRIVCDSLYNWKKHFDPGQFDAALGCGIFTPGQLKPSALDEIVSVIKPGGIMVMSVRQDALDSPEYGYQSKFTELQKSGTLKLLKKELIRRYADAEATQYTNPYGYIIMHQVIKHH